MNNLIQTKEPILALLETHLIGQEPWMVERFTKIIGHFYRIPLFKNFLDLIMTNCSNGKVKIKLQDAKFFDLDEGNCLTMLDKVGYSYLITIKKLAGEVVIHELGHLLEKELQAFLNLPAFASMVHYEIANLPPLFTFMKQDLDMIFIKALEGYKSSSHLSEIFARFFEFFASAKDIAFDQPKNYLLKDVMTIFGRSLLLLQQQLPDTAWTSLIDSKIAEISSHYLKTPYKATVFSNKIINKSAKGNSTSARWGVKSNADSLK